MFGFGGGAGARLLAGGGLSGGGGGAAPELEEAAETVNGTAGGRGVVGAVSGKPSIVGESGAHMLAFGSGGGAARPEGRRTRGGAPVLLVALADAAPAGAMIGLSEWTGVGSIGKGGNSFNAAKSWAPMSLHQKVLSIVAAFARIATP